MQKGAIKAVVLTVIFFVAVGVFSMMTNHVNEDLTTEMKNATLPVITLESSEQEVNELYGYRTKMNAASMRDTITPIGKDRKLPVTIQTYETSVDAISYEIRSLDGERLIANADVNSYDEKKGTIKAELEIQNLLQEGEEYLLLINLEPPIATTGISTAAVISRRSFFVIGFALSFVVEPNTAPLPR